MEKQTKEIITREWIEKELRFYNKGDIRAGLILFVCVFPVCVILFLFLNYAISQATGQMALKVLVSVFAVLAALVPLFVCSRSIWQAFVERKLLCQGAFDVSVCEVSCKIERHGHRQNEELLYFVGYPAVNVGHTTYQLASAGDTFYLVTYRTKKPSVKLFYATKMHEYRES